MEHNDAIVMEFLKDVSRPVITRCDPMWLPKGEIISKERKRTFEFQKGEQLAARILELTNLTVCVEIIDGPHQSYGDGLMLMVPRDVLVPEKKANIEWDEE